MAEIITYPLNGKDFDAEDVETFMCSRTSGVYAGDMDYTVTVTGSDNNVTVSDGLAWMRVSRFSGKSVTCKSPTVLDAGLPDSRLPRIDAVVLGWSANANGCKLYIKKGTPASTPNPPEVVRTPSEYELHLFHIRRNVGATTITPDVLTDLREDEKYCGIMYNDVTLKGTLDFLRKQDVGKAGGVASLGPDGKVPGSQLPEIPRPDMSQYAKKTDLNSYIPNSKKSSSISSTSTDTVATSNAVKLLGDEFKSELNKKFDFGENDGITWMYQTAGGITWGHLKINISSRTNINVTINNFPTPSGLGHLYPLSICSMDQNVKIIGLPYAEKSDNGLTIHIKIQSTSNRSLEATFVYV